MLVAQFHALAVPNFSVSMDETDRVSSNVASLFPNSNSGCLAIQFGIRRNLQFQIHGCLKRKPVIVSCKSSSGSPFDDGRSTNVPDDEDQDHDFLRASLLVSETAIHHRMRRKGFEDKTRRRLPGRWDPFGDITRQSRSDSSFVGHEFLRRFLSPTIFLKVSCDGEFLLPIIAGEFAIEKLLHSFRSKSNEGVKMAKITKRVVNAYYARVFLSKPGDNKILSIDASPSDAIIMANRCQAPIHVGKQIFYTDAIRITYGIGRTHDRKPTYDVSLDGAADGPDLLSTELDLVKNINLAIKDERYNDAAIWRDKLMELRQPRYGH